jgi:hypothetical protein
MPRARLRYDGGQVYRGVNSASSLNNVGWTHWLSEPNGLKEEQSIPRLEECVWFLIFIADPSDSSSNLSLNSCLHSRSQRFSVHSCLHWHEPCPFWLHARELPSYLFVTVDSISSSHYSHIVSTVLKKPLVGWLVNILELEKKQFATVSKNIVTIIILSPHFPVQDSCAFVSILRFQVPLVRPFEWRQSVHLHFGRTVRFSVVSALF